MLPFLALKTYCGLQPFAYLGQTLKHPKIYQVIFTYVQGKGTFKTLILSIVLHYFADLQLMLFYSSLSSLVSIPLTFSFSTAENEEKRLILYCKASWQGMFFSQFSITLFPKAIAFKKKSI